MKILVTGAAGFIGFHLSQKLTTQGHEVVGIDNINDYYDIALKYARLNELGVDKEDACIFFKKNKSKTIDFSFIRLSIEDRDNLPLLFKKENFDVVINLAAQAGVRYSIENPEVYIDSNIVGFLNILECCRNNDIKHLLYASSSSVYGQNKKVPFSVEDNVDYPISLYAATKKSNELMAHTYSHLYDIPTTGLRFFTVYGPWGRPDMAPFLFTDAIINDRPIKVFNNGEMSRDFTYIDDIVNGILLVLKNPPLNITPKYKLANIGNGNPESLGDFIKAIENSIGKDAKKIMMPMQPGDVPQTWADTKDLKELGYKSEINMSNGVSKFVDWYNFFYQTKDL